MADFNLILLQMVEDCKTNFSGNLLFKTRNVYIVAFAQNNFVNNALIFWVSKPAWAHNSTKQKDFNRKTCLE